jgi:hypothetical protein
MRFNDLKNDTSKSIDVIRSDMNRGFNDLKNDASKSIDVLRGDMNTQRRGSPMMSPIISPVTA